jgi:hypothetical protein
MPPIQLQDGQTVYQEIRPNVTHQYFFSLAGDDFNVTTMDQPHRYRKLIINLEPCKGSVYLFVRKTRRCYPNPYSCVSLVPGEEYPRNPQDCEWTHFMSEIDGSRDGTPTFFEIPFYSTRYYMSVFATLNSAYTLTVLADIGALPRPGERGKLAASQEKELAVSLAWHEAFYIPEPPYNVTDTKQYWIYSSMLLDEDNRTNMAVFLRPDKIMNTVCGLQNNTDRQYSRVTPAVCSGGICNTTVDGVVVDKRYVFNVVAESHRGMMMAYSGLIVRTQWSVVRQATDDKTLKVVGGIAGAILAFVLVIYFLMLKLYG